MAQEKKKSGKSTKSVKKKTTKGRSNTGKSGTKADMQQRKEKEDRIKDEIWSILLIAVGVFLVIALQTEAAGKLGHGIRTLLMGCFGIVAFILPYYLIVYGGLLFAKKTVHIGSRSGGFVLLIFFMMTLLNSAGYLASVEKMSLSIPYIQQMFRSGVIGESGGAIGMTVGLLLVKIIGMTGLCILAAVVILISVLLVINTPFSQFIDKARENRAERREREEAELALEPSEAEERSIDSGQKREFMMPFEKDAKSSKKRKDWKQTEMLEKRNPSRNITNDQMKILNYMKDDDLFDRAEGLGAGQVGLETSGGPVAGLGLDGDFHNNIIDNISATSTISTIDIDEPNESLEDFLFSNEEILPLETAEGVDDDLSRLSDTQPVESTGETEFTTPTEPVLPQQVDAVQDQSTQNVVPLKKKEMTERASALAGLTTEAKEPKPFIPQKYEFPNISLLNKGPKENKMGENELLKAKAVKLEQTLHDFNVNAKVVQVTKGPAVTRYEIQPNTGVKVSSIVRLSDDIALNLEAKSIRMEAPIPGKAAVGIEVENDRVNMVTIREIIESAEFNAAKSKISFAVGKDIAGNAIVADLKSMPHMLIAGSTGSGKSVCINSIIISLLYKARPDEVKLVLVDPKVVELGNYNGIPHLLIPVVTDPSKAAAALNWAVAEMTDRYKKFAEEGVRDLASYNERVKAKGEDDLALPQIVIIIDELADLMMAAPSQVEESICRLAQMARAAGMHLIVATQRPSVDIITGVIKANIPSRIAFAVSSQFDSRTILDMSGAEKLVGKGDMLFNPLGMAKPVRVQGTFISDSEVHNVIEHVKGQVEEAQYADEVLHSIEKVQAGPVDEDSDELLSDAIETVVKAKQASVSMLQRRFRIGYNRAARLVDMMEQRGIIGPADGSRPRQVFLTEEQLMGMDEELMPEE